MYGRNIHNNEPQGYLDINRMDYYVCGAVERDSNGHTHNNVAALKAIVAYAVGKYSQPSCGNYLI